MRLKLLHITEVLVIEKNPDSEYHPIVTDLGVRGGLLKEECKSCAFAFFSRTHALRETQTCPCYTRYDCRSKSLPGSCRGNFNCWCFRMHSHAERGKEGNTIFPWLHELNEPWEHLIYVAQCKTQGIWNEGGFGTRPYRFTPQCTLSTNHPQIRYNQIFFKWFGVDCRCEFIRTEAFV